MGYSLSWLAIKGKSPKALRGELGFRATGKREEIPEAEFSSVEMPNGWYLIISNHTERVAQDSTVQRLSLFGCELVTCFIEEHVMCSGAAGWKDGHKRWSVNHDAQRGTEHLETYGDLPPVFSSIRDRLFSKQQEKGGLTGDVDYIFNIPVEIARSLTGYQHDRDIPGLSKEPFEVLVRTVPESIAPPQKPSFWNRLFRATGMIGL